MDNTETDNPEDEFISKTQVKQHMLYLQNLGLQLVELPEKALKKIPLDEHLRESIELARRISARGGRKRQLQYIGKLMRSIDVSEIEAALEERKNGHQEKTKQFHLLEQWRDRLINEEHALQELIEEQPNTPIQEIRQLIRQAKKEASQNKPPKSARKLFSLLRDLFEK